MDGGTVMSILIFMSLLHSSSELWNKHMPNTHDCMMQREKLWRRMGNIYEVNNQTIFHKDYKVSIQVLCYMNKWESKDKHIHSITNFYKSMYLIIGGSIEGRLINRYFCQNYLRQWLEFLEFLIFFFLVWLTWSFSKQGSSSLDVVCGGGGSSPSNSWSFI